MPLVIIPAASPTGDLRYEWVDPTGVVRDLTYQTSPHLFVSRGALNLGTAGSEIVDEKLPTAPGSVVRRVAVPPSRIELPITVNESAFGNVVGVVDALRGWFDTGDESRRTPGYLRVTRPDGSVRQLLCYYAGGLDGDLSTGGPNGTTYVVTLFAPDPWPTASTETVKQWTAAELLSPIGEINPGQMAAYPIWRVYGPSTSMSVGNLTTGKAWSIALNLPTGKVLLIDTRPSSSRTTLPVVDSDGVNRFGAMVTGTVIFGNWLVPGLNSFFTAFFGTSAATRLELRYTARYRGMVR